MLSQKRGKITTYFANNKTLNHESHEFHEFFNFYLCSSVKSVQSVVPTS